MPEFTSMHIALMAAILVVGAVLGWLLRSKRSILEKGAINAGWQQQLEAQRSEHERLTDQNKGLMEQIGQYQASNTDAKNRAKELSGAVQEAYKRRDKLQREIKDIRNNLESAVTARARLQSDFDASNKEVADAQSKDAVIAKLESELQKWQDRLPPLIDRIQQRNKEATQIEVKLHSAQQRIAELEAASSSRRTHIEPVRDPDLLTDGRAASNDPIDEDDSTQGTNGTGSIIAESDKLVEPQESNNRSRDELQRIKGIGPAIQKTLNEIGIFSFQQIADMTEYDIDRVAKRLKGFHSRIYREDWIGQARDLHAQGSGGS